MSAAWAHSNVPAPRQTLLGFAQGSWFTSDESCRALSRHAMRDNQFHGFGALRCSRLEVFADRRELREAGFAQLGARIFGVVVRAAFCRGRRSFGL